MAILIKGMKMPDRCDDCPCYRHDSMEGQHAYQCNITLESYNWGIEGRPMNCPLVELPEKHNRLLDERSVQWAFNDAILDEAKITGKVRATWNEIYNILRTVPTVIEAEGNDNGV